MKRTPMLLVSGFAAFLTAGCYDHPAYTPAQIHTLTKSVRPEDVRTVPEPPAGVLMTTAGGVFYLWRRYRR